jgi:hypothetical protein
VFLAVILDAFSRKVVGWELDRTLAARLRGYRPVVRFFATRSSFP